MCILFAEDDPLIRMIMAEELMEAGFDVCVAGSGEAALNLLKDVLSKMRLLVTDVHMPGPTNGIDVARAVHRLRPDVPVVYMTGRPDVLRVEENRLRYGDVLLSKPFTPSRLIAVVRQVLRSA